MRLTAPNSRPFLVTLLTVLETLVGVAAVSFAAFLLYLSSMPDNVRDADAVYGLRTAAAMFAVPGIVWVGLALLLFRGVRWGWWVGIGLNLGAATVLGMDVVDEWSSSGADDIALASTFLVLVILYALPPVWRYRRTRNASIEGQASAAGA